MSFKKKAPPAGWSTYERGRASSVGSLGSIDESQAQQEFQASPSSPATQRWLQETDNPDGEQSLRQRNSSVFNSLRQIGGINNLDNFARSFQRAATFRQITPARRGSVTYGSDDEEAVASGTSPGTGRSVPNKSLLRQQFEAAQAESQGQAVEDGPGPEIQAETEPTETSTLLPTRSRLANGSFSKSRLTADSLGGAELGTSFGSISSRLTNVAQRRASILIQKHVEASMRAREAQADGEEIKDDYLDRPVEVETREDGEVIERTIGESTVPMTIFNSINVLIGVGILALPLAMKYAGWVLGLILVTAPAFLTHYTARILAKCLDTNSGSTTYGDLAFLAFGNVGRAIVEILFVIELLAANVALFVLFGDSMHSLVPSVSTTVWKAIISVVLMPLNHAPFRALSVTSILGIVAIIGVIVIVFADGFIKPTKPGSLRDIMPTHAFPTNWLAVPLSFGLFVAPWGGHSVFPAVYKDMRHPVKYHKALKYTYITTYGLDLVMTVFGYLMFSDAAKDEVSSNILNDSAYPRVLSIIMVILICLIPVTKVALSNRPLQDTANKKLMIDLRQMDAKARAYSEKSWKHRLLRLATGVACNLIELGLCILVPDFDSVMSTMGASVCLIICAILPIAFYLKIFSSDGKQIPKWERIMGWILIVVCAIIGVVGTVFAILPKSKLGVKSCTGIACTG